MLYYPKPYSHETFLSFIFRVAKENLMDNPSWIFHCIESQSSLKLKENLVNWVKDKEIEGIATFLQISLEEAKTLSVVYNLEKLGLEVGNISKNPWFLYSKSRFCPNCLVEGVYQRKSWINTQSIMCLKHNCFLLDRCKNCHNISNINDIIQNNCTKCNKKLSDSLSTIPKKIGQLIFYQKTINQIILENKFDYKHSWIKKPATFMKALEFLALWVAKLIKPELLSIANIKIYFEGNILESNHLKNFKTIEQSICLYKFTFNIIDNWPTSFYEFLDYAEENNETTFISLIKYGIPKLINTDLWSISQEFTNYLAKEKFYLNGVEFLRSDEIKHFNTKFYGSIIHSELLKTHRLKYKGLYFNLIERDTLEKLLTKIEDSYSKEVLRNRWGTSPKAALSILRSGYLKDTFSFKTGSVLSWIIPASSVLDLESKIKEKSSSYIKNPISLNNAFKWGGPDKAHLIFEGMLTNNIGLKYNNLKLSNTLIEKRDCYYFIREKIINDSLINGFISIRNLVFILGVKQSDIKYWIKTGRFGESSNFLGDIPIDNFINFSMEFMTTYELAFHFDLQIKQIIKQYSMGKFKSLSGPEQQDGKRLLFKRKDYNF
jgi:hypothetical protein